MTKDVVNVGGEERTVREDTAKSYRGVIWALLSVGIILLIAVILFLGGFLKTASDGNLDQSPAQIEKQRQ
jgi:hypothetical protein